MAALPYMQLYVADYLADTAYLDVIESGAYLHLLMNYWQTGKPLPDDDVKLARIARCSEEQWFNVRSTVVGYFVQRDGQLIHNRVERDLKAVRSKIEKASEAGKKSAESRRRAKESNSSSTDVQRSLNGRSNERSTTQDTDTDTDTDKEKKRAPEAPSLELPDWLNQDLWKAFLETRQTGKTKFTPHAKKLALSKLESLCPGGRNHEAVINQTIENGWKTFYELKGTPRQTNGISAPPRTAENML